MYPLDLKTQEVKSSIKTVPKVWGEEIWIVNCPEYCGKFLIIRKGAKSSYHYHKIKKETFYALSGQVCLTINGRDHLLNPFSRPKTILPNTKHGFLGITDATLLEISTHHDDEDVVRLSQSHSV